MLKKQYQLPSSCFRRLYQKGKTRRGKIAILRFLETQRDVPRFGFVISSKAIKKATKRNLIKRRASEIANSEIEKIKPGIDFVFIIKEEADFSELKEDFKKLLNV